MAGSGDGEGYGDREASGCHSEDRLTLQVLRFDLTEPKPRLDVCNRMTSSQPLPAQRRMVASASGQNRARPPRSRIDPLHRHPPVKAMWLAAAGGALMFAILAIAVQSGWTETFDRAILLSLRDSANPGDAWGPAWFEETMAELSALGGYPILVTVTVLALSVLVLVRHRSAAAFLLAALGGGAALSSGLKLIFERARPDLVDHMDRTFTSSFPSAHAMVSMLSYLTLASVAVRFVPRHSVRVFILCAAAALGLIIGASRVYLGVHWPSDVLAGWSLGVTWASLCWLTAHYLSRNADPEVFGHSSS
ncbi:undecaprenyl-diphosphatase [Hoeflea marina]|uniref:Undecaprenyl-diphosphatase n=2 Tax=Hoeflea marina TaxID=274592 RepID=A0A317PU55_9HYPH|nr:undecaprenyl-diphosphatase [Hoeflea marina]